MVKRFSQLEKNQTKRDEEINKQFSNFSKMLEKMSQSMTAHDQEQGEKKMKNSSQAVKRSYSELMELADDSKEYQSEREELYDSDMGQEDKSGDQSQYESEKESGCSEEEISSISYLLKLSCLSPPLNRQRSWICS